MNRVTKKDLYAQIEWLNKQFNVEEGAVGSYQLDCAYGGYRLTKLVNESGGQSDISPRGTARETMNYIWAFSAGAEAVQREVNQ